MFGGTAEPWAGSDEKQPKLADTTLLQFSKLLYIYMYMHGHSYRLFIYIHVYMDIVCYIEYTYMYIHVHVCNNDCMYTYTCTLYSRH